MAEAALAASYLQAGDSSKALEFARAALLRAPSAEAFGIAALALEACGEPSQAVLSYRAGLAAFPDDPALGVNLARLLRRSCQTLDEALTLLYGAVAAHPDYAPARLSLIETLRTSAGRPSEAEAEARVHTQRFPEDGAGHLSLALCLFNQGKLSAALASAERSTALAGKRARAWELKANLHVGLGDPQGAMHSYRALLALEPDPDIHSRLLMAMQYCDAADETEILEETRRWVRAYGAGVVPRSCWPQLGFDPGRPLNVGIVSGDFRQCSTPFLALPLFEHWPADWIVTLYSNVAEADAWTSRFRRTAARWVDISGVGDEAAAARICEDRIDVLVDLNGHTLGGRLGIFRHKPAPVQVAWLDYVGSTGLPTFDAIIADAGHLPLTDQALYSEPIHHVADNLYRYLPAQNAPDVSELPARQSGFVTFGCFNSAYKLSPPTLARWSAVLHALPTSRLLLNAREFGFPDTVERFSGFFEQRGISRSRIDFRPGSPDPFGMLASYREIDIALDPFPYSGGLTTLEALHMGVPVITLPGARFGSRHSSVHLRALELTDWIADDSDSYIRLATRKAAAVGELAGLRSTLRARLASSCLVDGSAFAQQFSDIVRRLWRAVCARSSNQG